MSSTVPAWYETKDRGRVNMIHASTGKVDFLRPCIRILDNL